MTQKTEKTRRESRRTIRREMLAHENAIIALRKQLHVAKAPEKAAIYDLIGKRYRRLQRLCINIQEVL